MNCKLPALTDPNFISVFERAKDSNLFNDLYHLLIEYLGINEFNIVANDNIEKMFKLLMDHRDYYRNQYHQTLSDLEKMNKELRDSRESMESKIDQQKKDITEMQKTLDDLKTEVEEISADKEYWKNEAEMFKNGYMKALEHKKEAETLSDELHLVKAKLDAEIQIRQHMKELLNLPDSVLDSEVPNNPVNEEEYLNHLEAHENVAENEQCQQSQKRVCVCSENEEQPSNKNMRIDASTSISDNTDLRNPTFLMPVLLTKSSNETSIQPLPFSLLSQILGNPSSETGI